jgi:hypothetical protein
MRIAKMIFEHIIIPESHYIAFDIQDINTNIEDYLDNCSVYRHELADFNLSEIEDTPIRSSELERLIRELRESHDRQDWETSLKKARQIRELTRELLDEIVTPEDIYE